MDDPRVLTYAQAIEMPERAGDTVAILGAGGIGFDVAQLLAHPTGAGDPTGPTLRGSPGLGIDTALPSAAPCSAADVPGPRPDGSRSSSASRDQHSARA